VVEYLPDMETRMWLIAKALGQLTALTAYLLGGRKLAPFVTHRERAKYVAVK
jgi:hypothetical protein